METKQNKWEIIIIDFNTMVWVCLDQWDLFQCLSCGFCLITFVMFEILTDFNKI